MFSLVRPQAQAAALAAALLFIGSLAPRIAEAQFTITVPTANIASGKVATCKVEGDAPVPTTPTPATPEKTNLKFKFSATDKNPADMVVLLDGTNVGTIPEGMDKEYAVPVLIDNLQNGIVSVRREDSEDVICSLMPWVTPRTLIVSGPNYTSFVADGAIGKALRGGPSSDVTGSIGIDHRSEQTVGWKAPQSQRWFRAMFRPLEFWRSKGEELHAVLTVASSSDSLFGGAENFGSAILAPSLSGSGSIQGETL